jgi:hypothetical protein
MTTNEEIQLMKRLVEAKSIYQDTVEALDSACDKEGVSKDGPEALAVRLMMAKWVVVAENAVKGLKEQDLSKKQ